MGRRGAVPSSPSGQAIARFNSSDAGRTAAGLTRSLGQPKVSVGAAAGSPSEVRITVAWELCWYQWGVDVDGGARGNPGPAAIAAVVQDTGGGVLEERGEAIGRATNNVAEYRALLLGIERAAALGASELELVGDSELVVKQVKGEYKVKDATMRELHSQVRAALKDFERWSIRHVRRERNAEADRLVNEALDA